MDDLIHLVTRLQNWLPNQEITNNYTFRFSFTHISCSNDDTICLLLPRRLNHCHYRRALNPLVPSGPLGRRIILDVSDVLKTSIFVWILLILSLVATCNCSSGLRASPKILSLASAYSCSLWNKTTNRHPSQCCLCCPLIPGTRTQNLLVRWGAMRNIMLPSIQHRQCHREARALRGLQTVQS
jgi:hypothetical protein